MTEKTGVMKAKIGMIICVSLSVLLLVSNVLFLERIESLRNQANDLNADRSLLESQVASLQKTFEQLNNNYTRLNATYTALFNDYNELGETNVELIYSLNSLIQNYSDLNKRYDTLLNSYDILSKNYSVLICTHQTLQEQYLALNTYYLQLQANYVSLETAYNILLSDYRKLLDLRAYVYEVHYGGVSTMEQTFSENHITPQQLHRSNDRIDETFQSGDPSWSLNYTFANPPATRLVFERLVYRINFFGGYYGDGCTKLYFNLTDAINGKETSVLDGYMTSAGVKTWAKDYSPLGTNPALSPPTTGLQVASKTNYGLGGNKTICLYVWVDAGYFQFSGNGADVDFGYGTCNTTQYQPVLSIFGNGEIEYQLELTRSLHGGQYPWYTEITDPTFTYPYGDKAISTSSSPYTCNTPPRRTIVSETNPVRYWGKVDSREEQGTEGFPVIYMWRMWIKWLDSNKTITEIHGTNLHGSSRTFWELDLLSNHTITATSRQSTEDANSTNSIWSSPDLNKTLVERLVYKVNMSFTASAPTLVNFSVKDNSTEVLTGILSAINTWTQFVVDTSKLGHNWDASPPPSPYLNNTLRGTNYNYTGVHVLRVYLWKNATGQPASVSLQLDFGIGTCREETVLQPLIDIWHYSKVQIDWMPKRGRFCSVSSAIWIGDQQYDFDYFFQGTQDVSDLHTFYSNTILASITDPIRVWLAGDYGHKIPTYLGTFSIKFMG